MKNVMEEIKAKMVAKNQRERLGRYIDITNELLATGKSLVIAPTFDDACKRFARVVSHAEGLWDDACILYLRGRFATATAVSITCLEEIGKISVARFELAMKLGTPRALQSIPNAPTTPRRKHPFYSHSQKLLLAAGAGALVNSRLDRIVGMTAVIAFLDDVEFGRVEPLRQSCLYSEAEEGRLLLPAEQLAPEKARSYVVIAGEILAEVAGFDPTEWERLITKARNFEKQIGHAYE
jgi:AbiV family abortive infection protein